MNTMFPNTLKMSKIGKKGYATQVGMMALVALVALLAAAALVFPAHAQTVRGVPNIVLVHGAWADGSGWSGVTQRLQAAGFNVSAPQLPETSLADDVARVRQVLSNQSGPTLLVAHSYGGAVISALGTDAPNVVGLVYIAAFAPDEGEALGALVASQPQLPYGQELRPDSRGFLYMSEQGFLNYFAPDVERAQARALYAAQQPPFAGIFEEPLGVPSWKSLPSWYLVSNQDQIIAPAAQLQMAQRIGATIQSIDASHVSLISHPAEVASFIDGAASSLRPDPRPNITATPAAVAPSIPGNGSRPFPETGKTVRGIFLDYWNAHGGLAQQGYPISELMVETSPTDGKPYMVQYFERAVFEYHPENEAQHQVLLSLLGSMRYKELYSGNAATR